ncbi:MAG: sigma-70 family RNA polymerase sigma factor [Deltaproteobacteria bacterium]|nr:sigma-70 family RNA polymerase sigma factor [Deltaproteobacteria bacterium]
MRRPLSSRLEEREARPRPASRPRPPATRSRGPSTDRSGWPTLAPFARAVIAAILATARREGLWLDTEELADLLSELQLELLADPLALPALLSLTSVAAEAEISDRAVVVTKARVGTLRRSRRLARIAIIRGDTIDPGPEVAIDRIERGERLTQAIARLPERERELVELFFFEAQPAREVAAQMGITLATVYSKKSKLEARLRGLLATGSER